MQCTDCDGQSKIKGQKKARYLDSPGFPLPTRLEGFDLATAEPLQLRPFKPKYHLTMGNKTQLTFFFFVVV